MKKSITLSINAPCSEKWESFSSTQRGAFCGRCQKQVVDMTKMSDRELLEYLKSRTTSTCARMRQDQLRNYDMTKPATSPAYVGLLRAAVASALLLLLGRQASAQTKATENTEVVESATVDKNKTQKTSPESVTVSGRVVDETGVPLAGASISLAGASIGIITDADGRFTFPGKLNAGETLLFSFIGYVTKEFKVKEHGGPFEIELKMDEIVMMGELVIDEPFTIEAKKSAWARIKNLF